jgi:hypothetical protein
MHYSKCRTNDGKTIADVQTWLNEWRSLVKKEGIEYRVRLLVPHADSQLAANEFYIEGGSPTLQSYAKAWQWCRRPGLEHAADGGGQLRFGRGVSKHGLIASVSARRSRS